MLTIKTLLAACLLAVPAFAQQVHVVDLAGGTPFQQIQPAIDAAVAGDAVEIRPGVYEPFTCGKALRIEGEGGVVVAETPTMRAITVSGVAAGVCSVADVALRSQATPCICEPSIRVEACAGMVVIDHVFPEAGSLEPRVDVTAVAGLLVRDSFVGPLVGVNSTVQYVDVTVRPASTTAAPLIDLTGVDFEMTDGALFLATQCCTVSFELANSVVRLRSVHGLQLSLGGFGNHDFQLDAASRVDYDPGVTFAPLGVPRIWPFGTPGPVVASPFGGVRVTPAPPGGTVQVSLRHGVLPSFICPVLASMGPPIAVPGISGSLFLDGVFAAVIGCYPTGPSPVQTSFPLPADPTLSGQVLAVQGLALTAGIQATNVDVLRIL